MCIAQMVEVGVDAAALATSVKADYAAGQRMRAEYDAAHFRARVQEVDALNKGALTAGLVRQQGTQVQGEQRLAFADAGIDLNSGTSAQVQRASTITAELDAATAKNNARREALGFRQYQGQLDRQLEQWVAERDARRSAQVMKLVGSGLKMIGGISGSALGG